MFNDDDDGDDDDDGGDDDDNGDDCDDEWYLLDGECLFTFQCANYFTSLKC